MNKNVALITGASTGIGYELSKIFAKNGSNLVLVARDEKKLRELAKQLKETYGTYVLVIPKDLSNPEAPKQIYDEITKNGLIVDTLVNNAGFNVYGAFDTTSFEEELNMIQVNIVALTHLTKLYLPEMKERGKGRIMNVGSTGSFVPGPLDSVYCATKAYVLFFSEAIAEELRGSGVTVTTLMPGATNSNFAKRANMTNTKLFSEKTLEPRVVAEIGYKAMMKGRTRVITGLSNNIQIFSLRFMPRNLILRITKNIMSNH